MRNASLSVSTAVKILHDFMECIHKTSIKSTNLAAYRLNLNDSGWSAIGRTNLQ